MKTTFWRVAALSLLCLTAPARGQQADPKAAFSAAVDAYRDQIRAIEKLYAEFQTADPAQQDQIDEQLKPLVREAKQKADTMTEAALAAYKANPGGDPEVTELLLSVVEHQVVGAGEDGGGDQYEKALPILEALVDGKAERAELPIWGVLAAVCTNEFDLADKFAKIVVENGLPELDEDATEEARATFASAFRYLQAKDQYRERWEEEKAIRDAEAAKDDLPRVKVSTSAGDVVIELFEDQAPIATANFITLVKKGYYDGIVFHRVLPRFMAQGGDPTGTGSGGPGYSIPCECFEPDARMHFRGSLSMAHAGRDTGGSQFFLCFVPTDFLDGRTPQSQHTVFGRVIEGIETIGEIQAVDPSKGGPKPDQIIKAEVIRDRGHSYDFRKLPGR